MQKDELSLNARWTLAYFDEGQGETHGAHLPDCDVSGWMDAVVPGDVHLDLMRAGKIADPFVGLNYLDCRWIEDKEWWYRRDLFVPESFADRRVELQFGGLDTFATIWVNGRLAGTHCNMFVQHTLDISGLLNYGHRNSVAVRFASPIKAVAGKPTEGMIAVFETHERLHARKAQMSYGWDIAPRLVTTGIWRPVYLVARGDVSIGNVAVRTASANVDEAVIEVEIPVQRNNARISSAKLLIQVRNNGDAANDSVSVKLDGDEHVIRHTIRIPKPKLWWPWNVGKPNLYKLSVSAFVRGEVAEEYTTTFGIRTVELIQEPQDDGGQSFAFAVNGETIFARGTNWIPGDAIFARMNRTKYRELIELALANGVNMLRVWGGGIYEDPYFYRLCDEQGIMVWQDFMFTCGQYPQDEGFLQEVRYEAEKIVTSLRNHPSVVLWCGDNEVDATAYWSGKEFRHNRINREVLSEVCANLDPTRQYIHSSPFSPSEGPNPQEQHEGDTHIWHHGTSFRDDVYTKDTSRFVSEIGHLSIPWPESVRKFIPTEHLWPPENKAWDFHFGTVEQMDPQRRAKVDQFIANFGIERPDNLDDYAYISQMIQAFAYKEWIEHCRRRKPLCGGILYWNLYDNWPQFSDAAVDYYRNPKMAYYFASRAFTNLLVSLQDLDTGMVGVWLVNDDLKDRSGNLLLRCQRLDGGTAWTRTLRVSLPANSSRMAWSMTMPSPLLDDPCAAFTQAQLQVNGRTVSESFYFPTDCREIQWPRAQLSARLSRVRESGTKIIMDIGVASEHYARLVRVETPDRHSIFSDNFIDIPPGEERTIRIITPRSAEPVRISLSAHNAEESISLSTE